MMRPRPRHRSTNLRRPRPARPAGVLLAVLVALVAAPTIAPRAAAAATVTQYTANCPVNLRASASMDAAVVGTIATGSVVTVSDEVTGNPYSADCIGNVSGTHWFVITAVAGKSVSSLYGVGAVYAASELFFAVGMIEGIDVSGWQGAIDYGQVAAAGRRFVIAKATEGIGFTDSKWTSNRTSAPAGGLALGGYHFARPDLNPNDPVGEADWFVSQLGLVPGMLVPALDLERRGTLSTAQLQAWVQAWLDEVYAKTGARAMIYTSPAFWKSYVGDTSTFAAQGYKVLWIAHWFVSSPRVPASNWGGYGWTFWQYDNSGTVPGISGRVDLDRYNGTDLTPVTFGANFALGASSGDATTVSTTSGTASATVEQGGSATFTISVDRDFFTLPVALSVSGLPAGATASVSPNPATGSSATLKVTTSASGTPVGKYQLTVTGTANGLSRATTVTLAVTDALPPAVKAPVSSLYATTKLGTSSTLTVTRWSASDPSGIASYSLQRQVDGGSWTTLSLASATSTAHFEGLSFGHSYRFRVRATDRAGNTSGWAYGPTFKPLVTQQSSSAVGYSRGWWWSTARNSWASGGSLKYTKTRGALAVFRFTGSSISWVAARGPGRGVAYIYVDGKYTAKVDLYSSTLKPRQIVFAYNWAANGTHTISVVSAGTSGRPRIDVDAFVRLYRV